MIDNDETTAAETGREHVVRELGFAVWRAGDELRGNAEVTPFMHAPGTPWLRTSILAMWGDMIAGLLALGGLHAPVTLDLAVHLYRPAPTAGLVEASGRAVRAGRTVFVGEVDFFDAAGDRFGFVEGSFVGAPGASAQSRPQETSIDTPASPVRLAEPLADRVGCERLAPGIARLPLTPQSLNSSRTLFGGLIALVAEEAALPATPGKTLCSLMIRYLSPVRTGPAVAMARTREGLSQVEVRDAGARVPGAGVPGPGSAAETDGKLAALVTTRAFC
jgi:acyl-coenzyme A thioesterase PaaI-like protein